MQIVKYKKMGKNKYKIFTDCEEFVIYEDIIFKYNLLLTKNIDLETLDKIIDDNKYYEAYYLGLNYIDIRLRSKKEVITYLTKKDIETKYIEFAIDKLDKLNLFNTNLYIKSYINDRINLSNDGPYKIKKSLIELGFNEENIYEFIDLVDNSIWKERVNKIISKKLVSLKNKSYYMIINKLNNDLYNLGYDSELINECLSNIEYDNSNIDNEYKKAFNKYKTDNTKIINYLLRKGYTYDEIKKVVK